MKQLKETSRPTRTTAVHLQAVQHNDMTIEKMHELFSHNARGFMVFRDELMGLLARWEQARATKRIDRFTWRPGMAMTQKPSDRIGRGTIHTKNLCVSILGSTQPSEITLSYFEHTFAGAENDGLLQRFQLFVYPDDAKEWKLVDQRPNDPARGGRIH